MSVVSLAARLVDKGLIVIDPRGALYSGESIGERRSIRDFMAGLRSVYQSDAVRYWIYRTARR